MKEKELSKPNLEFKPFDRSDHCDICGNKNVVQILCCEVFNPIKVKYISGRCNLHALTDDQLNRNGSIFKIY